MTRPSSAQEARSAGWCSQHHLPRAECDPADRHVQSFRASDELMDAVAANAATMGLSRNDGIEMAREVLVGWHEAGQPWKGPAQWTRARRAATLATGAMDISEHRVARRVLETRDAVIQALRERDKAERERRSAAYAARKARNAQIVTAASAGADYDALAAEHGLTRKQIRQIVAKAGSGSAAPAPAPSPELPRSAPGSAVFLEPGGKPRVAAAVPEVPASRNKKGRR